MVLGLRPPRVGNLFLQDAHLFQVLPQALDLLQQLLLAFLPVQVLLVLESVLKLLLFQNMVQELQKLPQSHQV